jgi:hypothetical protein
VNEVAAGGEGVLSFVVWPPYAGAVKSNGEEPMFGLEYQRGQITWAVNEAGILLGSTTITVPAGEWAWIIYCHSQFRPGYTTCSKLAHPLVLHEAGTIDLHGITENDIKPLAPDPVLHD